jgi:hypothetical protein
MKKLKIKKFLNKKTIKINNISKLKWKKANQFKIITMKKFSTNIMN